MYNFLSIDGMSLMPKFGLQKPVIFTKSWSSVSSCIEPSSNLSSENFNPISCSRPPIFISLMYSHQDLALPPSGSPQASRSRPGVLPCCCCCTWCTQRSTPSVRVPDPPPTSFIHIVELVKLQGRWWKCKARRRGSRTLASSVKLPDSSECPGRHCL